MIYRLKYFLACCFAIIFTGVTAQTSQILYYMNLPQNHLMNPALRPSNSVYVGLPAISGIFVGLNNNFINYSDVFHKGTKSDSVYTFLESEAATNDFLDKLNKKNSLSPQITLPLLGIGFSTKNGLYFFFDINDRIEGNFVLPGDLIELALKGNGGFVGDEIDLSSLRMDVKYYREYGFTVSKEITNKLRIGIRPKLFTGVFSNRFENRTLGISVNDDFSHTINADFTANFSGPFNAYTDKAGNLDSLIFDEDYFTSFNSFASFENRGLGIDLGATYKLLNDKVMVSASLTDLGYIKWRRNVTNLTTKGQFVFNGLDMTNVVGGEEDFADLGDELLDSLKNTFKLTQTYDPYKTWLSPGLTLGGSYNLNKNVSFGVLSYSRFIGKQVREALTLSANLNLSNALSFSLGYTMQNHRADNLGAGLAFRAGIFQFYFISDRIPVSWNRIKLDGSSSVVVPANWNTINLRLGMNLSFGNKVSKKNDKPLIRNEQTF
ncbi:MAG: hypothetical protein IPN68_19495 [Bacteroidetes bacterium]|nr:hypothetical protein [Bacteroidota bacterium]